MVREASVRSLGLRPFDVQLLGGIVLHEGSVAEMRTGEGKTLVAVLPAFLNALAGSGVHVVTVNDYLARRDSEWVGQVHKFLGLSVGLIQAVRFLRFAAKERKCAYRRACATRSARVRYSFPGCEHMLSASARLWSQQSAQCRPSGWTRRVRLSSAAVACA